MKNKFKIGDAVIDKITGKVYFVTMVFCNGMITVEDEFYRYLDHRSPDLYDLYNPRKDV